jgi:hypothetical protein
LLTPRVAAGSSSVWGRFAGETETAKQIPASVFDVAADQPELHVQQRRESDLSSAEGNSATNIV